MESTTPNPNQQVSDGDQKQKIEVLGALISAYGLDAADLVAAIQNLAEALRPAMGGARQPPIGRRSNQEGVSGPLGVAAQP